MKLKKANDEADTTLTGLHKQHASIVKALEDKVCIGFSCYGYSAAIDMIRSYLCPTD